MNTIYTCRLLGHKITITVNEHRVYELIHENRTTRTVETKVQSCDKNALIDLADEIEEILVSGDE